MKCPVCLGNTKITNVRSSVNLITTRTHECEECLTTFKTQEKIMFETLPQYVRNNYLNTGRLKG